ncbi:hypothetical protein GND95_08695 [Defluviitalea raffinosedens]|uniref:Capsid protein n=1 Tax=Defluviitalea raffinosedens TaxID=1450156 RepID=A0A7C8HEV4_9FIRM|nr:hypothetical protein [Defluviitalea raffinosedens]KAE9633723.1 hypothetical protein GND95_08695 [Defluviitalea raffinosedens]
MAINTIEYAKIFQQKLDEQMIVGATSGWMEANAGQVKYNGGDEVKIPEINMNGLGDYDRDNGFPQGSVSVSYATYKLTQDRGRTFLLDAMDVDESNFVASAGNVMGEFQRTKVIPEVDSYRYSKIAALASAAGNVTAGYTPSESDIYNKIKEDIAAIQDKVGDGEQLVITMAIPVATILDNSSQISKKLDVTDFAQGNVNLKVKSIDGIPIIKVPSARMKSKYVINDGVTAGQEEGGIVPDTTAVDINWIITVRRCPIAISKTDKIRIFTPDVNQKADAWKLDYRKYHDLWIPKNKIDGVWVNTK